MAAVARSLSQFQQSQRILEHYFFKCAPIKTKLTVFFDHLTMRTAWVSGTEYCSILKIVFYRLYVFVGPRKALHHVLIWRNPNIRAYERNTYHLHHIGPRGVRHVYSELWKVHGDPIKTYGAALFVGPIEPRLELRTQRDVDRKITPQAFFVNWIEASIAGASQSKGPLKS